ncbi:MAG: signal peptidase I [Alphaproteobacteria bacterium]
MNKYNIKKDIRTVVEALLIAMLLRSLLVQPFTIPSGSMYPTLMVGDYLYVTKYSYGISRYSFPFGGYWLPDFGRVFEDEPKRGEVVVFRVVDKDADYIKRLVGMPGDTIQVKGGTLYINGVAVKRERLKDTQAQGRTIPTYKETLPNGKSYAIWEAMGDGGFVDDTREFKVPAGHYFMMGDNRDESNDSRYSDVGFVPIDALIGPARKVLFSLDGASHYQFWKWYSSGRGDRIFKAVE